MSTLKVQRSLALAATMLLPLSIGFVVAPQAGAGAQAECRVTNVTSGAGVVSDLQAALGDADSGDLLHVRGQCVGNYTLTRSISLVGVPTAEVPVPALDGASAGSVLAILGEKGARVQVTISDLTIRNGRASTIGGGINSRRADVVLDGTSAVVTNQGQYGGGIAFTLGRLVMNGDARVVDNMTYATGGNGGGVYLRRGAMTLNDHAVIAANSAATGGGIYTYKGTVFVGDEAIIEGNHASNGGGGILTYDAPVRVRGSATIRGNDAYSYGGGVYLAGYREGNVSLTVGQKASVIQNTSVRYGGGIASSVHGSVTLKGRARVSGDQAEFGGGVYSAGRLAFLDEAEVVGNTATTAGGGLFATGEVTFGPNWSGTVCGNDPDDWPGCQS